MKSILNDSYPVDQNLAAVRFYFREFCDNHDKTIDEKLMLEELCRQLLSGKDPLYRHTTGGGVDTFFQLRHLDIVRGEMATVFVAVIRHSEEAGCTVEVMWPDTFFAHYYAYAELKAKFRDAIKDGYFYWRVEGELRMIRLEDF